MGVSTAAEPPVRLLGLGNEILADDAVGILVAREVERRFGAAIQVVTSSETGFNLLDKLVGVGRLLVVDAIVTGKAQPGTMHVFEAEQVRPAPGISPHFIGLFEVLALARGLGMPVPRQVTIIAVEAADCFTVGGPMHPDVRHAIPLVVNWIGRFLAGEVTPHA